MKIGIAQFNAIISGFEHNFKKIKEYSKKAKENDCDLIIFPELTITGYPPLDLIERKDFIDDNLKYLQKAINEITDIAVILGFIDKKNNNLYNSAILFQNQKILFKTYKRLLPNYDVFDEKRYFKEGNDFSIFQFNVL